MPLESKKLALKIGDILKDKKAEDITLLEVYPLTIVADYFIIASGRSEPQVSSLYRELTKVLAHEGIEPKGVDGKQDSRWIALDYGDVIVHIFHSEEREFYDLERLWADAQVEVIDNKA